MAEPKEASAMAPSSGTAGFFQPSPELCNTFEDDETWRRMYNFYLPSNVRQAVSSDLDRFSKLVIEPKIRNWCADAEDNVPYVRHWDSWGRRIDELITSEGWRNLQDLGIQEGIVAIGHEGKHGQHARVYQFLKYHIWTPWCAYVTCPSAMTDGAARLLSRQLKEDTLNHEERLVFQSAYEHLISRDISTAWTSGQWMTERPGGSDVQSTETQARCSPGALGNISATDVDGNPLGAYSISGFKWFSSATDADASVLLAKEASGAISAFFAPTKRQLKTSPTRPSIELNGIAIQRMKSKLGTRALPTAELELDEMRAWRIGKSGQGVKEISTILNITRVHNAVTAVGLWGRGLAISRAFSRVRAVRGRLLADTVAHVSTLAEQHVQYRAMMHLTYFTASLLGVTEQRPNLVDFSSPREVSNLGERDDAGHLLRLFTPLAKMLTAKASIAGLAECMESLGGVGYLENEDVSLNIARLFRDANVLSIWEGTTNIMADDLVRIVKGPSSLNVLNAMEKLIDKILARWKSCKQGEWAHRVSTMWTRLRSSIEKESREDLSSHGRALGRDLGWIACSLLLGEDALSDGDDVAREICSRWILDRDGETNGPGRMSWAERAVWDRRIVFGRESAANGPKL